MENRPIRFKNRLEDENCRRREKQFAYQEKWDGAVKYYESMEKKNMKFENWTSPRYYEVNNELMSNIRKNRDKKELLEKRRERLKQLYMEDDATYEIELVMSDRDKYVKKKTPCKFDEIPTELLNDINNGLKLTEQTRRKNEAEKNLYHQWRTNHPVLRECQSRKNFKDLKLSWLDQQIEKRMAKEREEEQSRKLIKERDEYIKEQRAMESELQKEIGKKNDALQKDLEEQITEFHARQRIAEELQRAEKLEIDKQAEIYAFEEKQKLEEVRRKGCELALFNLKQYKFKLKQRAADIQENLENERRLVQEIIDSQIADRIYNEAKKFQIKQAMDEFLKLTKDLKEIEHRRKQYFSFSFDSEAKSIYENQQRIWCKEQEMRTALIDDVLREIKAQIDRNVERNMDEQKMMLLEREESLKKLEEYNDEMENLKEFEERKKLEFKTDLDEQVKENKVRKKRLEKLEQKSVGDELDKIKDEEERLKNEIMRIQSGKSCPSYGRRRFFY